ncbi:MAG: hypothetical protein KA146_06370 [Leptospiraceae bacterium]|nr:hypothetical protein [Leptospiraceae bacterium]
MPINDTIFKRLEVANEEERERICKIFNLSPSIKNETISAVYREAGGHSVLNLLRDVHDLPYTRILIDVADKVKPGLGWTSITMDDSISEEELEDKIWEYLQIRIDKTIQSLSEKERKDKAEEILTKLKLQGISHTSATTIANAFITGGLGYGLASAATISIFYSGFFSSIMAGIFGVNATLLAISGTGIGALVGLPLLAVSLGTPAYRKTIPATIEMIGIRLRLNGLEK